MTDPSPVPWVCVWIGCVIAVAGAIVAMSGWGQREPHRMDTFGKWVAGFGVTVMVGTLLLNGAVIGIYVCGDLIKTIVASAQPTQEWQAPTK